MNADAFKIKISSTVFSESENARGDDTRNSIVNKPIYEAITKSRKGLLEQDDNILQVLGELKREFRLQREKVVPIEKVVKRQRQHAVGPILK